MHHINEEMSLDVSLPCQWSCVCLCQNVQRMKQSLPRELEKHLKKKCLSLLSYYQPEWGMVYRCWSLCFSLCRLKDQDVAVSFLAESESEGLKNTKLSHLSTQLDQEKKRTASLKEMCRENTVLLQRQIELYLCVGELFMFLMKLIDFLLLVPLDFELFLNWNPTFFYTLSLHWFVLRS